MANPFYTPSGNPGAGTPGLSAVMRSEFEAISVGFDQVSLITEAIAALATGPSYDNDAQAAAGGVELHTLYRNGNFVMVRMT